MSWEVGLIGLFIGLAFYFVHIGLKGDNNQLPLKLVFVTLSMGSILFALNVGILVAGSAQITDTSISDSLVATLESGYTIMLNVFWMFIIITALSVLFMAVNELKRRRR